GGAAASLRRALELDPNLAGAHINLGTALRARGDLKGAVASFRRALAIDPKYAQAHGALGLALLAQGHFADARAAIRACLDLLPKADPLRKAAEAQLRRCESLLALDKKLPAVLAGEQKPADAAERLGLGPGCPVPRRYA